MYSFAFQPIVNVTSGTIDSFEALVRGANNESPQVVFERIPSEQLHRFDQRLRVSAIALAARLRLETRLNLNFLPKSLELSDEPVLTTLEAAVDHGFQPEQIVLEITESEAVEDLNEFARRMSRFRGLGLKIAIDDFGSGYSGLNLLAAFQPDIIKLDMSLVRSIDTQGPKQAIVRGIQRACCDLGIDVLAEGIETVGEFSWCVEEGIELYQGYLFGKPGFEHLPTANYPRVPSLSL